MRHRSCADPTFGVELTGRVKYARNSFVCADRIKRSAERIKAVPDGIILDDLQPRLVCHFGWNALDMVEKKADEARPAACFRAPPSHAPQLQAPQVAQVATRCGQGTGLSRLRCGPTMAPPAGAPRCRSPTLLVTPPDQKDEVLYCHSPAVVMLPRPPCRRFLFGLFGFEAARPRRRQPFFRIVPFGVSVTSASDGTEGLVQTAVGDHQG